MMKGGDTMESDMGKQPTTGIGQPAKCDDQPRIKFHYYEEEYSAARAIVGMLTKRVEENPKLNLCVVRRLCELMVGY